MKKIKIPYLLICLNSCYSNFQPKIYVETDNEQNKITEINKKINSLRGNLVNIEKEIEEKNKEILDINKWIEILESEKNNIKGSPSKYIDQHLEKYESSLEELKKEVENLNSDTSKLKQRIEQLEEKLRALEVEQAAVSEVNKQEEQKNEVLADNSTPSTKETSSTDDSLVSFSSASHNRNMGYINSFCKRVDSFESSKDNNFKCPELSLDITSAETLEEKDLYQMSLANKEFGEGLKSCFAFIIDVKEINEKKKIDIDYFLVLVSLFLSKEKNNVLIDGKRYFVNTTGFCLLYNCCEENCLEKFVRDHFIETENLHNFFFNIFDYKMTNQYSNSPKSLAVLTLNSLFMNVQQRFVEKKKPQPQPQHQVVSLNSKIPCGPFEMDPYFFLVQNPIFS